MKEREKEMLADNVNLKSEIESLKIKLQDSKYLTRNMCRELFYKNQTLKNEKLAAEKMQKLMNTQSADKSDNKNLQLQLQLQLNQE